MRSVSIPVVVLLAVAALFWGNCLSCPQMLAAVSPHDCCPGKEAPSNQCTTQGLQHFVKADAGITLPAFIVISALPPSAPSPLIPQISFLEPAIAGHAPPRALSLTTSLRV